jgi:hypothetical protein
MTMNRPLLFTLCLVAGVAAQAQVVRLEVDYIDNGGLVPGDTYRVYAVMQSEGDIIDAVFGEASAPLSITSTKPFYQHPEGGPLSADIQRQTAAEKPALAYDSWVTIGSEDNYMNAVSGFIMDFTSFNEGGELATNDGAWFVTPDKRQAMAPPSKRILLMQLTTAGKVNGLINIHGRTKAETDAEGNVVSGQQLIQAEGLVFECYPPR